MTKRKRNRKEYVVGYVGDRQVVYGPDFTTGQATFIERMTLPQAKRKLEGLWGEEPKAIYKLVPVAVEKRSEGNIRMSPPINRSRQALIYEWAIASFGIVASVEDERALRFFEEATELMVALGIPRERLSPLMDRAYSEKQSSSAKELAQAGLTLECLAECMNLDLSTVIDHEFDRVRRVSSKEWRERQNWKAEKGLGRATDAEG